MADFTLQVNGNEKTVSVPAGDAVALGVARHAGTHRNEIRLWGGVLWRLHGARGGSGDSVVLHAGFASCRESRHDD